MPIQNLDDGAFESSRLLRSISERLEIYRLKREWTILKLASECDVSYPFMRSIMDLRANPSVLVVQKMADRLKVPTAWLCGHSRTPPAVLRKKKRRAES